MKGISTVIATILLLLIAIAMIGFSMTFFTRTQSAAQQAGEQQLQQTFEQIGTNFQIESVDKNRVYIRNTGTAALAGLNFYVSSVYVNYSGPASLAAGQVGTYYLDDGQLSMLPDPALLRVTSAGPSVETTADFYGNYDVGYWKFDEGSGTTASDSSGNGNTGTLLDNNLSNADGNTPPTWVDGKYGKALQFDGVDDYVDVPYSNSLNLSGASESVFLWVKPSGSNILFQENGWSRRLFYANNNFTFTLINITTGYISLTAGSFPPGQWYEVGYTINSSQASMYVNGELRSTAVLSAPIKPASSYWWLGRVCGGSSCTLFYNGTIDEVRILSTARSMTTA